MPSPRAGRRSLVAAALLGGLGLVFWNGRARAEGVAFHVIVHRKNSATSLSRQFVADAFLGKAAHWPNEKKLKPADLRADSATRAAFSRDVIGRSVAAVRRYWQQRIFSGQNLPPPAFDTDEGVVAYVARHEGAIGYVSPAAALGETKVVAVR